MNPEEIDIKLACRLPLERLRRLIAAGTAVVANFHSLNRQLDALEAKLKEVAENVQMLHKHNGMDA